MSNSIENDNYVGEESGEDPTRFGGMSTGLIISEMPSQGATTSTMAGLMEAEMPSGAMNVNGGMKSGLVTAGEMPGGPVLGAATDIMTGAAVTEMPTGDMTASGSMTSSGITGQMPVGAMKGAATATIAGLALAEMPIGAMMAADGYESETKDDLPSLEAAGEWHLTLSTTSLKRSARD